jgi:hypothetical protein
MQRYLQRTSTALLVVLVFAFSISTIGVPRHVTLTADEIMLERPDHLYMLTDTPKTLRTLPSLFEVLADPSLAATWRHGLTMFENGVALPDSAASYDDMLQLGGGRYNYRPDRLTFTTMDNSDPRSNGRMYVIEYRLGVRWRLLGLLAIALVAVRGLLALLYPAQWVNGSPRAA